MAKSKGIKISLQSNQVYGAFASLRITMPLSLRVHGYVHRYPRYYMNPLTRSFSDTVGIINLK